MTTMTTTSTAQKTATERMRAGLAISAVLGLLNIAFIAVPTPDGQDKPPVLVIVVSALLGLVNVLCAIAGWRSGNRAAVRINAAVLIVSALLMLPAFFVDIPSWIKVVSAVAVIATVAALVLTLRREPTPFTVTD